MNALERGLRRLDTFQQRHRPTAFAFAVIKKFGDDRGGSLAALLTYYGFLSLFPLLLLLVTGLGFVLGHNPDLQRRIVDSALSEFPIIGTELRNSVNALHGSGLALFIGVIGLLWGSLGVSQAAQHAMAEVWNIPGRERPGFFPRLGRSFSIIALLASGLVATTALSGVGTATGPAMFWRVLTIAASVGINAVVFFVGYRLLTPKVIETRSLVPGALLAAAGWSLIQTLGGYLVAHQLRQTSEVYGFFAIVLGLVAFLSLGANLTIYAAEVNVVRARRLWPRSIVQPPLTDPDRAALREMAQREERRPEERIDVRFVDQQQRRSPEPR
ncbi:MAG: YihY/virulence factor BrkB family protein [Actinomycetota bacterium]|nr:YihY/virulence factor BrkB family protein [Actinomycetota bacterium]